MGYILTEIRTGYFDFCKKAIPLESYIKREMCMKRLLIICSLVAAAACVKEPLETSGTQARIIGTPAPEVALQGALSVKLSPEMARTVAAAQAQQASTRAGGCATRSGVDDIDALLEEIGADRFQRIVDYDPEWEAVYDRTGMNCWYRVAFDKDADLSEVGTRFAAVSGISAVEYEINPRRIRPLHVGRVVPARSGHFPALGETRASTSMNDRMLPYQWHFDNAGPNEYFSTPRAGADINLLDAWQLCTGDEEIVVAVLDEPVQTTHPDLAANIWSNPSKPQEHGYNFWDNTAELDWRSAMHDEDGWTYADHGTHVAGVIAAVNNNSRGVCGIAGGRSGKGGVKIMSCQIMGYGDGDESSNPVVKAFEYAWRNGAVIAQNSWGYDFEDLTADQIDREWDRSYGVIRTAIDTFVAGAGTNNPNSPLQGGLVIFAAGNDGDIYGDAPMYPAAYSPVIAVGAMDWAFCPAYYTDYGTWVDMTAPGGDVYTSRLGEEVYADGQVLSTILCDNAIDYQDGRKQDPSFYGYGFMQGTSMACPHVSGVAALGLSYAAQLGRKYTAAEFKSLLLSSVYGIDHYFTGTKEGITVPDLTAYQDKMGGGCVDALKLLLAIRGTSAIYIPVGESTTVDFARFFGGERSKVALESADLESPESLGIAAASQQIDGTQITFRSTRPGVSILRIKATAGDTEFTREFAVVSRAGLAGNGGWL